MNGSSAYQHGVILKLIELPDRNVPIKTAPIMGGSKHPEMHSQCQKAQTKPSTGESKHTKVLFQSSSNTKKKQLITERVQYPKIQDTE